MCPRKPRQNTFQCSVLFRLVCIAQCVQYIHCEVLQVVRRSAVFRVPAAWWYVAGWPAQLSPNRQPHKAFLQDHLWQRSFKRDFNKYMAGSKDFLLEHLSYKLMITIPRHHTRHKMLHISISIWFFLYSCSICCCICRYLRSWNHQLIIRAFGWKLGCWNGRPLIWEAPNDPSKTPRQPILCGVLYLYLYLYLYMFCFFVSLWWSTEPDTFLLSAFSAFNTSLIWIERESPDASYLHLMSDKPFELIINARKP